MKILIYVHERTAIACGQVGSGAFDWPVSAYVAENVLIRELAAYSARFVVADAVAPAADVHRLVCDCATDDSVLDALGSLKHRVELAQAWGKAVVLAGVTTGGVPHRVAELWNKYPLALYRSLLGDQVAEAVRMVDTAFSCLDCGAEGEGFHACPGRPGENRF